MGSRDVVLQEIEFRSLDVLEPVYNLLNNNAINPTLIICILV